jgi:hypothetical protein
MALGLALMVGIRLPMNFNSPYKAHNIIDFWRRWHMTLSRFLRDIGQAGCCLEVVGHTNATGLPAVNDRLPGLRTDYSRTGSKASRDPCAAGWSRAGKGSREMIVGTGRDDASDSLDRRVELKVMQST